MPYFFLNPSVVITQYRLTSELPPTTGYPKELVWGEVVAWHAQFLWFRQLLIRPEHCLHINRKYTETWSILFGSILRRALRSCTLAATSSSLNQNSVSSSLNEDTISSSNANMVTGQFGIMSTISLQGSASSSATAIAPGSGFSGASPLNLGATSSMNEGTSSGTTDLETEQFEMISTMGSNSSSRTTAEGLGSSSEESHLWKQQRTRMRFWFQELLPIHLESHTQQLPL